MKRTTKTLVTISTLLIAAGVWWFGFNMPNGDKRQALAAPKHVESVVRLSHLLAFTPDALQGVEIARMNLLCAQGLPGAEDLDVDRCLDVLDQMAARVRLETNRHYYRFQRDPSEFEHSEGYFRMIILAVVLAEDFQVKYAPNKIKTAAEAHVGDGFFGNAEDVFLHGLTGPRHQGTCSSLPVLQVAVGRRLGYPLKLVTTKGHLFVRWEDSQERFNIEAAGNGVNRFSDDYYRQWPLEVSDQEVAAEGYLKSLSPAEELAVFLSIRGMCFLEAGQIREAGKSFMAASQLSPGCSSYKRMQENLAAQQKSRLAASNPKP